VDEDGDESSFTAEPGRPSPGQLTADKASCSTVIKVHVFDEQYVHPLPL